MRSSRLANSTTNFKAFTMTLEKFRQSGKFVNLNDFIDLRYDDEEVKMGMLYDGLCYVEKDQDDWYLAIGNLQWSSPDLSELEEILYDWYSTEILAE